MISIVRMPFHRRALSAPSSSESATPKQVLAQRSICPVTLTSRAKKRHIQLEHGPPSRSIACFKKVHLSLLLAVLSDCTCVAVCTSAGVGVLGGRPAGSLRDCSCFCVSIGCSPFPSSAILPALSARKVAPTHLDREHIRLTSSPTLPGALDPPNSTHARRTGTKQSNSNSPSRTLTRSTPAKQQLQHRTQSRE